MKSLFFYLLIFLCTVSCKLTSTTYLKPNETFVLGNNEHGRFSVRVKNISPNPVKVWRAPITGGRHSPVDIPTNTSVKIRVEKNTALQIENTGGNQAAVNLLVKGDTGLSMGYKNEK